MQIEDVQETTDSTVDAIDDMRATVGDGAVGEQVIVFDDDSDRKTGWLVDWVQRVEKLQAPETEPVEENEYVSDLLSRDGQLTLWIDSDRVNALS